MGRNAEITRDFYDAYNRRDWEALARLMAPTVEWFHAGRGELIQGVEAVTALLRGAAEAFPEALVAVNAVHEAGATVTTEWSYASARSRLPAKGAQACDVKELRDGKLVRGATYGDTLQMLLDLDTGPAPAWIEEEPEAKAVAAPPRSIIPAAPGAPVIRYRAA